MVCVVRVRSVLDNLPRLWVSRQPITGKAIGVFSRCEHLWWLPFWISVKSVYFGSTFNIDS